MTRSAWPDNVCEAAGALGLAASLAKKHSYSTTILTVAKHEVVGADVKAGMQIVALD